jgi:two-component system response regulator AtoC
MSVRLLVVEDDDQLRGLLLTVVGNSYAAEAVPSAEAAIARATTSPFDVALIDVSLPQMSGIDLIPHLSRLCPGIVIIFMSGNASVHTAVEAMKRGAIDFLTKPFNIEDLLSLLKVAVARLPRQAQKAEGEHANSGRVVARSANIREVLTQATTIASFNTTVLVTGETGTGKELLARSIHQESPRAKRPFVALNCAAVPEQLLEDELFGHVKGAFTGAHGIREGRFEQANGGTLFLDEIGDMSLQLQAKLLRVLQEREFEKLGSSRTIKVDVRIIAATSADLERRIADGSFRADLYYRLNVVRLHLPPLRQRTDDIQALAEYLLGRFCSSTGLPTKRLDESALAALASYRWPGNIRQLQNAMERGAAMTGLATVIRLGDLPEEVRGGAASGISTVLSLNLDLPSQEAIPDQGMCFDTVVTEVERDLLLKSLKQTGGNKMQAAKLLNMKRTTFVEKLKRLGIPEFEITAGFPTPE